MPADNSPTCRVCGRDLVPNARGDLVACCSRFVAPPLRLSPVRSALQPWVSGLERVLFAEGRWANSLARALVSVVALAFLVGLFVLAAQVASLF